MISVKGRYKNMQTWSFMGCSICTRTLHFSVVQNCYNKTAWRLSNSKPGPCMIIVLDVLQETLQCCPPQTLLQESVSTSPELCSTWMNVCHRCGREYATQPMDVCSGTSLSVIWSCRLNCVLRMLLRFVHLGVLVPTAMVGVGKP